MYMDTRPSRRTSRFVDTESHRSGNGFNHWSYELGVSFARCTKGIVHARRTGRGRELFMALTFGTLLSSQGADAHRHNPFGRIGGNPRYFTWSVPLGQTPAPAQTPTWSGRARS